jgi:hypothetical protein
MYIYIKFKDKLQMNFFTKVTVLCVSVTIVVEMYAAASVPGARVVGLVEIEKERIKERNAARRERLNACAPYAPHERFLITQDVTQQPAKKKEDAGMALIAPNPQGFFPEGRNVRNYVITAQHCARYQVGKRLGVRSFNVTPDQQREMIEEEVIRTQTLRQLRADAEMYQAEAAKN